MVFIKTKFGLVNIDEISTISKIGYKKYLLIMRNGSRFHVSKDTYENIEQTIRNSGIVRRHQLRG